MEKAVIVVAVCAFLMGALCNYLLHRGEYLKYRNIIRGSRTKKKITIKGITEFLYVTTQIAALVWVSLSYLIAFVGTLQYGMVYPVESLSEQAIVAILGVTVMKTVGNIFEHNDGKILGESHKAEVDSEEDGRG